MEAVGRQTVDRGTQDLAPLRSTFHAGDADLVGTLALPAHAPDAPIALLVHGDGPRTRFSDDAMLPLVNSLLDAGIGVFAWDKQGTGRSSGDWLAQSCRIARTKRSPR
ncbi:hypothetical protein L0Z22_38030 [Burkholderia cepacia]|nr:hypothetical protein [Burkholderia cepacia]UQO39372.1 hypothetical protein L0Z22_38030 [Burkholderia cepacia]UQO49779.1 hypothetical protein L0Z05_17860 [Burkholderia cepacia]UQP09454.1 hypothetical protein L0Z01_38015 [Burkholderia cepacia]